MWTVFKVSIEFVTTLLLFYVLDFFFWLQSLWYLSSPTRDQTCVLCIGGEVLTTGPPGKSPQYNLQQPFFRILICFTFAIKFQNLRFFKPVKNNGIGGVQYCHFINLQSALRQKQTDPTRYCCCCLVTQSCLTVFQPYGLQPTRLLCPWGFPGKDTGVGSYFLLKGIFLTQRSNPHLLHCRQILYH